VSMSSALWSVLLFAIEEYSDIAENKATCYVHFDRSACYGICWVKKSWPPIIPKQGF
jgi:hypothetical protein